MRRAKASKGALIFAGVVAGLYAGATLGEAVDDSADGGLWAYGAMAGGTIGGLLVWQMLR